jgi:hypothetical protein
MPYIVTASTRLTASRTQLLMLQFRAVADDLKSGRWPIRNWRPLSEAISRPQ